MTMICRGQMARSRGEVVSLPCLAGRVQGVVFGQVRFSCLASEGVAANEMITSVLGTVATPVR